LPSYQSFLVGDYDIGLELDKESWLIPQKAFTEFKNVYIQDGVITARKGFTEFADTESSDAIVGIHEFIEADGVETLIVNTVDRLYEWNGTALVDKDGADNWTGSGTNLVSAVNANGKLYMVNGSNQLRSYNGTAAADVKVDISDDTVNDLDFALFVFFIKERLILFHTSEDGTRYPQRVRWSSTSDVEDFTGDDFIDAPTGEWLVSAVQVHDDVIVWFDKSTWLFRYTGDPILPFRWEKMSSSEGASAGLSAVAFRDSATVLGKGGLILTDGVDVQRIDSRVPDLTLEMALSNIPQAYGILQEELRQVWLFYPSANASANDSLLVFNFEKFDWARHDNHDFTCAGLYSKEVATTWNTITGTWAEQTDTWISGSQLAGYPFVLGGKADGKIYKLNDSSGDDGAAINIELTSGRWNPFKANDMMARLGYIDFLVSKEPGTSLSVDFYIDFETTAYTTETLTLDNTRDVDKFWVRLYSGATAASHKIRIYGTGTRPQIHAIMPAFKPAGRISEA